MLNNEQQSRKIRTSLACLGTIFTLIYGEYVCAKSEETIVENDIDQKEYPKSENIVKQRLQQFESKVTSSTSENSHIQSKLSQQLEQIRDDIHNNQQWTKNAIAELAKELRETKEEIRQYASLQGIDDPEKDLRQQLQEMKLEEEALKNQIAKLIQQLEQDVKNETQKTGVSGEEQDRILIRDSSSYMVPNDKIFLEDWMTTYYYLIKDKLLKDIVIPGTHDSGTAVISENNAVFSRDGRVPDVRGLSKIASKIVPWSKTQDLTIKEQLDIGVRFFDFRVSVEENNELYLSHGLRGEKLSDSLKAITDFYEKNKHPKELVIIKVKGFPDKQCEKIDGNQLIVNEFKNYLSKQLISRRKLTEKLPLTKYSDLIKNGNIVILFDARVKEGDTGRKMNEAFMNNEWLFDGSCLASPWGNTVSVEELFQYSIKTAKEVADDKLYALHWTLTANAGYIGKHLTSEFGIRYLTSKLNGGKLYKGSYRLEDLIEQIPRINIVQHDFIDKDKAAYLVRLNWKSREEVKPSTASNKVLQKLKSIFNDVRTRNGKQSTYVEER